MYRNNVESTSVDTKVKKVKVYFDKLEMMYFTVKAQ